MIYHYHYKYAMYRNMASDLDSSDHIRDHQVGEQFGLQAADCDVPSVNPTRGGVQKLHCTEPFIIIPSLSQYDLTLVLLKPCLCKQWRSQLIWICTVIQYVGLYQKPGPSNLVGSQLEVGLAS